MTRSAGTRLSPYEILAPLGVGGMGEVYRTKDMKLGREVALKELPDLRRNWRIASVAHS
jgi:eukaryotic-like serine/threonine-protein kinase